MNCSFTGHPFVDAGIAGMAALLESNGYPKLASPNELSADRMKEATNLMRDLFCKTLPRKASERSEIAKHVPLCTFLLQETLPGSSWDQAKGKPDSQVQKFLSYLDRLLEVTNSSAIGTCWMTGGTAHLITDKRSVPMLSSAAERANCYPELSDGYATNAWILVAVLFSPLGIEKAVKSDGDGSECLIYHSSDWRFMVEIARANIRHINAMLAAGSVEDYRRRAYKGSPRAGKHRIALSTLQRVTRRLVDTSHPNVVIWRFNASNQGGKYEKSEVSPAFQRIYRSRVTHPSAYADLARCSDEVCGLILDGRPIAGASIIENKSRKGRLSPPSVSLTPGWNLQRLYAKEIVGMSTRLIRAVEDAAVHLAEDNEAVRYCIFESNKRPKIGSLVRRFQLPSNLAAVLADHDELWADYLRAAIVWRSNGNQWNSITEVPEAPGPQESLIKEVAHRLAAKYSYKRIAHKLSAQFPHGYRQAWITMLSENACTWSDFLAFNPLDEAFSLSGYRRTRLLRDYLIAYAFGCSAGEVEAIVDNEQPLQEEDEQFAPFAFEEEEE